MVDRVILRRYALPRCNCARECDIAILENLQTWNEPQQWNSAAIWYQFLSVVAWHCKYSELGPFQGTSSKLLFYATVVLINLDGIQSVWRKNSHIKPDAWNSENPIDQNSKVCDLLPVTNNCEIPSAFLTHRQCNAFNAIKSRISERQCKHAIVHTLVRVQCNTIKYLQLANPAVCFAGSISSQSRVWITKQCAQAVVLVTTKQCDPVRTFVEQPC